MGLESERVMLYTLNLILSVFYNVLQSICPTNLTPDFFSQKLLLHNFRLSLRNKESFFKKKKIKEVFPSSILLQEASQHNSRQAGLVTQEHTIQFKKIHKLFQVFNDKQKCWSILELPFCSQAPFVSPQLDPYTDFCEPLI